MLQSDSTTSIYPNLPKASKSDFPRPAWPSSGSLCSKDSHLTTCKGNLGRLWQFGHVGRFRRSVSMPQHQMLVFQSVQWLGLDIVSQI